MPALSRCVGHTVLKWQVRVLEAHESPESRSSWIFCGRSIAEILVREHDAERIGERLIKMTRGSARGAIRRAREICKQERKQEKASTLPRNMRLPFLFCHGCLERMHFPFPTLEQKSEGPYPWPTGTWTEICLHLGCGAAFAYSARDLRVQSIPRIMVQDRYRQRWRRLLFSCVEPSCAAQRKVFVCLTSAIAEERLVAKIFEQPITLRCPVGLSVPYGKVQQEEVFRLDWSN
jgi:hypothetical protein